MAKARVKKSKVSRSKSKVTRKSVRKPAKKLKKTIKSKMKKPVKKLKSKKRYMRQEEPGRRPVMMKSKPNAERIAAEIAKNYPKTENAIMKASEAIRHPIKTTISVTKGAAEKFGDWQAKRAVEAQKAAVAVKEQESVAHSEVTPAAAQTTSYKVPVRQGFYGRAVELPRELGEFKVTEDRLDQSVTFDDVIKREVKARNPALFENADLEVKFEGRNVLLKIVPRQE